MKKRTATAMIILLLAGTSSITADSRRVATVVGGLTLLGAAVAAELHAARTTLVTKRGRTSYPTVGEEASARPGEAVIANYNFDEVRVARFAIDVRALDGITRWPAGTGSYLMVNGKFCFPDGSACFEDRQGQGAFRRAARDAITQQIVDVPYELDVEFINASDQGFRAELLYLGAGGNLLRFGYREFVDDMARPAFMQELTYDLRADAVTVIAFQDATLEILAASNTEIRYILRTR
jgi:hypothetical protein